MRGLWIRWLVLAFAILIASYLIDGIQVDGFLNAALAAAVLGILNAVVRPVLLLLTLPITVLTLGFFFFVVNAAMLKLASAVIPGFHVFGFWPAVFGSLMISLVSWLVNSFIGSRGNVVYIRTESRIDPRHWD
jgi:putative membrane protein